MKAGDPMSVRVMHGAKAAGELLLLPLFLILVFGVCLPWLTVRRALGSKLGSVKEKLRES